MHHPTDRIAHTTAFVTPVVEHWLEREVAQWVHPWPPPPPWRIDPMIHRTLGWSGSICRWWYQSNNPVIIKIAEEFTDLFFYISIYLPICMTIYIYMIHLSINLSIHPSIYLSVNLSIYIHPSISLIIHPSIYPSINNSFSHLFKQEYYISIILIMVTNPRAI